MFRVILALAVGLAFVAGRTPAVFLSVETPREVNRPAAGRPLTDLNGNPVSRAVGGYRVDAQGDLYEEHNPDTAVLKLGSPTS